MGEVVVDLLDFVGRAPWMGSIVTRRGKFVLVNDKLTTRLGFSRSDLVRARTKKKKERILSSLLPKKRTGDMRENFVELGG